MIRIVFMLSFFCFGTALADIQPIKVGLFSIYNPRAISVEAAGKNNLLSVAIKALPQRHGTIETAGLSVTCLERKVKIRIGKKRLFASSVTITTQGFAKLLVGIPGKLKKRPYAGSLRISSNGGVCSVTNKVALEDYVSSVACHEIRGGLPEALRAQAVLVRTWAMTHSNRHKKEGKDFCDLTHCQVYTGSSACDESQVSVLKKVQGVVLVFGSVLADVAYFSTCGGHTANAGDIWGKKSTREYLSGIEDGNPAYCSASPHFRWHLILKRAEVCMALSKDKARDDCSLEIIRTGIGGWVKSIRIDSGRSFFMTGENFRLLMGRTFGWGRFKSSNFVLSMNRNMIEFLGKGMGHGVGMCQYGAMNMASKGKTFRDILLHYFPHTKIESLGEMHGNN